MIVKPPPAIACEALGPADVDRVFALHLAAIAASEPGLVKPEDRDFFVRILGGEGRALGAFRDGRLVGYGILQVDLPPSEDARPYLGIPPAQGLAKLAGAGVLPEERGAGLHDLFIDWRVAEGARLGIAHLYATAAPGNRNSWANLMAGGFAVAGLVEKYGGALRYLLHRRADAPTAIRAAEPPAEPGAGLWIPCADPDAQRAALARGRLGLRWRPRAAGGHEIWFRAP